MTSLKLPFFAIVLVAAVSMPRSASATTFNLTQNDLGISGSLGTATVTQVGHNIDVTITMKPGYEILTKGGLVGIDLTGGLKLTATSLTSFNIQGMKDRLESNFSRGGFTFSQMFETLPPGGQLFVSSLSFTIQNATVSEIAGLGIHFCVAGSNACAATGFAVTGSPASAVPEPGTLGLLGTGLLGLAALVRRQLS